MTEDGKPRTFTPHESDLLEEVLQHDGYQLLLQYLQAESAMAINALSRRNTSWEDTNYLRGKLAGLAAFFPKAIRTSYQSEKP